MTIFITPETEARLHEKARRDGQDANDLADALLADTLADAPNPLAELAGDMKDDPLFDEWCDSMRAYRQRREAELAREELPAA